MFLIILKIKTEQKSCSTIKRGFEKRRHILERGSWSKSLSTKRRQLINCTISKSDSNQVKDFGEDVQLIVFVLGHVKIMMDS
ncbi:unnamed protein product [Rhizophagus irregularis]|nr:unnamed protein product [Rhizophagus irregularis]